MTNYEWALGITINATSKKPLKLSRRRMAMIISLCDEWCEDEDWDHVDGTHHKRHCHTCQLKNYCKKFQETMKIVK